jgi:hypothetical protein
MKACTAVSSVGGKHLSWREASARLARNSRSRGARATRGGSPKATHPTLQLTRACWPGYFVFDVVVGRRGASVRHFPNPGATETAALRKRAAAPSLTFCGEFEFRITARTYFVMFSPRQCIRLVCVVRNAFAICPVQNNPMIFRVTGDIQNEAIGMGRDPGEIAQIVINEPDHLPRLNPRTPRYHATADEQVNF